MAAYRVAVSAGGRTEDDECSYWEVWRKPAEIHSRGCSQRCTLLSSSHSPSKTPCLQYANIITKRKFTVADIMLQIVDTFGFLEVGTYLIQAPPYLAAYFVTLAISWSSGRILEHCWHIVGSITICLIGATLMVSTLNVGARYFAVFLLCSGPFVGLNIQIAWETTVVPRPRTKRAALVAIANCVSSVSHWFTPYFFLRSQEPRYETGGGVIIAGCGATILSCLVAKWWCRQKNKALDREAESRRRK